MEVPGRSDWRSRSPRSARCSTGFRCRSRAKSGLAAVPRASLAVVFYGLLGGFPALFVVGGLGGVAAHAIGNPGMPRIRRLTLACSAMTALLGVIFMAVLDKLIGPY